MIYDGIRSDCFDKLTWHHKSLGCYVKTREFIRVIFARLSHLFRYHAWETNQSLAKHIIKHLENQKDDEAKRIFNDILLHIKNPKVFSSLNNQYNSLVSEPKKIETSQVENLNELSLTAKLWSEFYKDVNKYYGSKNLKEIWDLSLSDKEFHHDYIQVLFPQRREIWGSPPHFTESDYQILMKDKKIIDNLKISFKKMLEFYGLELKEEPLNIARASNFEERALGTNELKGWLNKSDHNYLRITRIIDSLNNFGLTAEAKAFYDALLSIKNEDKYIGRIAGNTLEYWTNAVNGKLIEMQSKLH